MIMNTITDIQIKENDVFSFQYNEKELKDRFSPYHCFDGRLIAKKMQDGTIILLDTYWASKHDNFTRNSEGRTFTIESALQKGELKFICNLNDVEEIRDYEQGYYADEDLFNLSYQHHCYKYFTKRKGAERSKEKMLKTINEKIEDAEHRLRSAERHILEYNETKVKIEGGDLMVYL